MKTKTIAVIAGIFTLSFCSILQANEKQYVRVLHKFDKAQSKLNYNEAVSYLSENLMIAVTNCDKTVDRFDIEAFKKIFSTMPGNVDILEINRKITKIGKCNDEHGCSIHSKLKEHLVAQDGKFDDTTISNDITHVRKEGGQYKIDSIEAVTVCK